MADKLIVLHREDKYESQTANGIEEQSWQGNFVQTNLKDVLETENVTHFVLYGCANKLTLKDGDVERLVSMPDVCADWSALVKQVQEEATAKKATILQSENLIKENETAIENAQKENADVVSSDSLQNDAGRDIATIIQEKEEVENKLKDLPESLKKVKTAIALVCAAIIAAIAIAAVAIAVIGVIGIAAPIATAIGAVIVTLLAGVIVGAGRNGKTSKDKKTFEEQIETLTKEKSDLEAKIAEHEKKVSSQKEAADTLVSEKQTSINEETAALENHRKELEEINQKLAQQVALQKEVTEFAGAIGDRQKDVYLSTAKEIDLEKIANTLPSLLQSLVKVEQAPVEEQAQVEEQAPVEKNGSEDSTTGNNVAADESPTTSSETDGNQESSDTTNIDFSSMSTEELQNFDGDSLNAEQLNELKSVLAKRVAEQQGASAPAPDSPEVTGGEEQPKTSAPAPAPAGASSSTDEVTGGEVQPTTSAPAPTLPEATGEEQPTTSEPAPAGASSPKEEVTGATESEKVDYSSMTVKQLQELALNSSAEEAKEIQDVIKQKEELAEKAVKDASQDLRNAQNADHVVGEAIQVKNVKKELVEVQTRLKREQEELQDALNGVTGPAAQKTSAENSEKQQPAVTPPESSEEQQPVVTPPTAGTLISILSEMNEAPVHSGEQADNSMDGEGDS